MIKSMVKYVEDRSLNGDDDTPTPTTSGGGESTSGSAVSPLMSFMMANDTNYKQKFYKPLLKRPSAGSASIYICVKNNILIYRAK